MATDVQRILDSCDRTDPSGIRDVAILMLVTRLGLRCAEVARLELKDIDWRAERSSCAARLAGDIVCR